MAQRKVINLSREQRMKKEELDRYFTVNEKDIQSYIKKTFTKFGVKGEEVDYFFTECYLEALKKISRIEDEMQLRNYVSTFIYNNCLWKNTNVRELGKVTAQQRQVSIDEFNMDFIDDRDTSANLLVINDAYYESLNTLEDKITWEIFFEKGYNTNEKFGQYLGKSRFVGSLFAGKLRSNLREFKRKYESDVD